MLPFPATFKRTFLFSYLDFLQFLQNIAAFRKAVNFFFSRTSLGLGQGYVIQWQRIYLLCVRPWVLSSALQNKAKSKTKQSKPSSFGNSMLTSVQENFGPGSGLSRKQRAQYLVHMEGYSKPLEGGHWRHPGVLLEVLVQVGQVEELIEAAVLIGDDVKHNTAILLIGVDMVEDHHGVCVELGWHRLPGPLVDDMNVSLKEDPVVSSLSDILGMVTSQQPGLP